MRHLHPPYVRREFVAMIVLSMAWLANEGPPLVAGEPSGAGNTQRVLEQAREICGSLPADMSVTFRRDEGMWRATAIKCWFRQGVTDTMAKQLAQFTTLESLRLGDSGLSVGELYPLSAMGLRAIASLPELRSLSIRCNRFNADLEAFGALTKLEHLDLHGDAPLKKISVEDLDHLKGHFDLRQLDLTYCGLEDDSMDRVVAFGGLEELTLVANSGITDAGIAKVKALGKLRFLAIDRLGPKGLLAMSEMPRLEHLGITAFTPVPGNADLSVLSGVKRLTVGLFRSDHPITIRLPASLLRLDIWNQDVGNIDVPLTSRIEHVQIDVSGGHSIFSRNRTPLNAEWLSLLRELNEITLIDPIAQNVKAIADLTSLRALTLQTLEYSGVEDEGMRLLAPLRQLESLTMVDYCRGERNKPIDEGLDVLPKLPALRRLSLRGFPRVTSQGLANVWKLTQLRTLRLDLAPDSCSLIDDEALTHVSAMRDLEELSLGESGGTITDKGIKALASLKKLRRLDFGKIEGYSDEALASLMTELPNLQEVKRTYSGEKMESEAERAGNEEHP